MHLYAPIKMVKSKQLTFSPIFYFSKRICNKKVDILKKINNIWITIDVMINNEDKVICILYLYLKYYSITNHFSKTNNYIKT